MNLEYKTYKTMEYAFIPPQAFIIKSKTSDNSVIINAPDLQNILETTTIPTAIMKLRALLEKKIKGKDNPFPVFYKQIYTFAMYKYGNK